MQAKCDWIISVFVWQSSHLWFNVFFFFFSFQLLKERFQEFAKDTITIGTERVETAYDVCDQLIASDHSDSATIAEWKDTLNERWEDLLELIETRQQELQASWERHKFFSDCKETLEIIYVSQHMVILRLFNFLVCQKEKLCFLVSVENIQYNLNGSNTDGSFTVHDSNSLFSPYLILLVAQENKYIGILFYHEIVCCVYSLELPHWGDSNEYTQHTIIV